VGKVPQSRIELPFLRASISLGLFVHDERKSAEKNKHKKKKKRSLPYRICPTPLRLAVVQLFLQFHHLLFE
jgi:hypothetical protein